MKKFLNRNISFISIIILITVWQVCGNLGLLPKFIFPPPLEIANAFVRDRALFLFHFKITMLEALIGLALGIFFACLLAIIMDSFEMINKIVYPLLIFKFLLVIIPEVLFSMIAAIAVIGAPFASLEAI